jgi:hypothetical protein
MTLVQALHVIGFVSLALLACRSLDTPSCVCPFRIASNLSAGGITLLFGAPLFLGNCVGWALFFSYHACLAALVLHLRSKNAGADDYAHDDSCGCDDCDTATDSGASDLSEDERRMMYQPRTTVVQSPGYNLRKINQKDYSKNGESRITHGSPSPARQLLFPEVQQ